MSTDRLVEGWWEYHRLLAGDRAERKALESGEPADVVAAADEVDSLIAGGGTEALELVLALVQSAADDDGVALVAAGPLEDLCVRHGGALAPEMERTARQDARFAVALRSVCWDLSDH